MKKLKPGDVMIANLHAKYVDNSTVVIGKCPKCGSNHSASVFSHQVKFRKYCYKCKDFKNFKINRKITYNPDPTSLTKIGTL